MKKEQLDKLKELEAEFRNNRLASAKFLIDGFKVTVQHEFTRNKLVKTIYVNGLMQGRWFGKSEYEEGKRFAYSSMHFLYPKKYRVELKKLRADFDLDEKMEQRTFITSVSISRIVKQWIGRELNKSIELIDSDGNLIMKFK